MSDEAYELLFIPHAHHQGGEKVFLTYIEVPQVKETNSVLLSKPFWIWWAENGANEHGQKSLIVKQILCK